MLFPFNGAGVMLSLRFNLLVSPIPLSLVLSNLVPMAKARQ